MSLKSSKRKVTLATVLLGIYRLLSFDVGSSSDGLKNRLQRALNLAVALMGGENGSILTLDPTTSKLFISASTGIKPGAVRATNSKGIPIDDSSIAGWVVKNKESLRLPCRGDSQFKDMMRQGGTTSAIAVLIKSKGSPCWGVLCVKTKSGKRFTEKHLAQAIEVAGIMADAIHRQRGQALFNNLCLAMSHVSTHEDLIQGLATLLPSILQITPEMALWLQPPNQPGKLERIFSTSRAAGLIHPSTIQYTRKPKQLAIPFSVEAGENEVTAGYLMAQSSNGPFRCEAQTILTGIADMLGQTLAKLRANQLTADLYQEVVLALATTLDARSEWTRYHSERVTEFSLLMGRTMELSEEELGELELGSKLHDLGKVAVDTAILDKPGRLTAEEFALIQQHPRKGRTIVSQISHLRPEVFQIILGHHGRMDGNGYPKGIKQCQLTRIVTVADCFDAMTAQRPYKEALTVPQAVDELWKNSGTQFDSEVVGTFVPLLKEGVELKGGEKYSLS